MSRPLRVFDTRAEVMIATCRDKQTTDYRLSDPITAQRRRVLYEVYGGR
jgi:hypothetical protein